MNTILLKSLYSRKIKSATILVVIVFLNVFCSLLAKSQSYTNHYIAPAPWQYFTQGNELIIATNSTTPVTLSIKRSDGTTPGITDLNPSVPLTVGNPKVFRFTGVINQFPMHSLNTVINNGGLVVIGDQPITVNIRNVVSDQGGLDDFIKGNSSLFSFGDAAIGNSFRVGYYRDGVIYNSGARPQRPIYSVMAINNGTIIKINGSPVTTLNAGQSYLFQDRIGSLVETSGPAVMNTSAAYDQPTTGGGCYDGTSNPVPPISSLGTEYIVVRGNGNNISEKTTVVASEDNTVVTVTQFTSSGALNGTITYTLAAAGDFVTFDNGVPGAGGVNTPEGQIYSASRIQSTKRVVAYSGTAENCEVDVATLAPISDCTGSTKIQAYKFRKYSPADDLPYFSYIIIRNATAKVYLTTNAGYSNVDIESLPGVGVRRQLGSSGVYLIDFSNTNIGNPAVITLESTSRLTVNMVQQGGGFSMSNFLSPLPEKALKPTFVQGDCASAVLSADPTSLPPFQWYLNGSAISGATGNSYTATTSGTYSVTSRLDCGNSAQSLNIEVNLCNVDRSITKVADNNSPAIGSTVNFTLTAKNLGPGNAINVIATDALPAGFTYVSHVASAGTTYNNTNGQWIIGSLAENGNSTATLVIKTTAKTAGPYQNTATITGPQGDIVTSNDVSSVTPSVIPQFFLASAAGTDAQTVCLNTAITPIVYTIGGSTSGAVANLPAGLTGVYSSGSPAQFTITGTPTNATNGPLTYSISTVGGPTTANITGTVTVNGIVATPVFNTYAATRCQGAGSVTYTATAANATNITYALLNTSNAPLPSAGTINVNTGQLTWNAAFSGVARIRATATGCNGPQTAFIDITVASGGTVTPDFSAVCSNSSGTLTATGVTGTILRWEYSTNAGTSWTTIANTNATQAYTNITATTVYRVVSQVPSCGEVFSALATVSVSETPVVGNRTANVCSGTSFLIEPSGVPGGTTYSWADPIVTSGTVTGGAAGTNATNISGTLSGNGTVTYTVTPKSGNCTGNSFTVVVTVYPSVSSTITYNGSPFCRTNGGTATPVLTGSGITNRTFSSTIGLSINASTGVIDIAQSQAGTYTVTYTYSNGNCSSSTTTSVTIQPSATISYAFAEVCKVAQTLNVTRTGNATGTYSISPVVTNGPTIIASSTNAGRITIASNTAAGTYTISYQVTGEGTCAATTTLKVVETPSVTNVTSPAAICSGGTATITLASITGTGTSYNVYSAVSGGTLLGAVPYTTPVLTNSTNADIIVNYYIEAISGCASTSRFTVPVTVRPLPTLSAITGTGPLCVGSSATYGNSQSGGTWSSSNSFVASINSTSGLVTALSAGPTTITYSYTNGAGCTNTVTYNLVVNAKPSVAAITGNNSFCVGTTSTLSNATTGGTWSSSASSIATIDASSGLVTGISAGTATITYTTAPNANGCTNTATYNITVNGLSTLTRSGGNASQTICSGAAITNIVYTYGGSATSVAVTGNISSSNYVINTTNKTVTISGTFNSNTNYTITTSGHTAPCTAIVANGTITVNPLPTATIGGTTSVCVGATAPTVTFIGANGTAPYTFTYKINGGADQTIVSTGNTATLTQSTTASGSFVYTLVSIRDASFTTCVNSANGTATVTVNPLSTATIGGTTSVCVGATSPTVTFTGANGTAPYTFTYKINGGADQTIVSTGNTATLTQSTTASGSFVYTLVSIRDAGSTTCVNSASGTATVTVNPLPTATIGGTTSVCVGATAPTVTFTGANGTAPYTFTYKINGGADQTLVSTGSTATLTQSTTASGSFVYTLVSVRDASSTTCVNSASGTATVTVNPLPTATIGGTTSVCVGATAPTVTFTGANGTAPYTFTYKINGGADQTIVSTGNTATLTQSTTASGSFIYTLVSVRDASSTTCLNSASGTATVTVNSTPVASNNTATLDCTGVLVYNLQNNITNGVNSSFTWTVSAPSSVIGAANGSGNSINQTLYNTSNTAQTVIYTVTPKATGVGTCTGNDFTVTVTVPVCSSISINKTSSVTSVNAAGNTIPYVITVVNTGNANQTNVTVTDALLGGALLSPVKTGGNTDAVLEKGETWTYNGTYIVTQADLNANGNPTNNNGKIINSATVVTDQIPAGQIATADVNIVLAPSISLVKTGLLNLNGNTIGYTFTVKNTGNVSISGLTIADSKVAAVTLSPSTLAPGATATGNAIYTILAAEKATGFVSNTATANGNTPIGGNVSDVSGTAENNDTPTLTNVGVYPINDSGSVNGFTGGTAVANVLVNDKLNGNQATTTNVTITQISTSNANVSLNASGVVSVLAGTAVGTYTLVYEIEDKANIGNKKQATVTVNVISGSLIAVGDSGVSNSVTGNTNLLNVLSNDTYNTNATADISNVTITQNSNNSLGKVTLDLATGTVAVAANTPAGVYTINYTIADKLDATKTSSADVVVTVSSNSIQAVADAGNANTVTGNASLLNVLTNDKFNGGTQATINDVTITQNTNNSLGKVTLDLATGTVAVAANTPAGVYTINYTITDKLDATKTSSADVVVTVSSNSIQAVADAGNANTVTENASLLNVLTNDKFNGGTQTTINDVTITQNSNNSLGKVTLDLATGTVAVAANTPAGVYTINYTITDKLDATKTSTADVVVTVSSNAIQAVADAGNANTVTGNASLLNVLTNDKFNGGTQATINDVTITQNTNNSLGKVTLDLATGTVSVAANTPAGVYTINYTITDKLDATKTSSADVVVTVSSNAIQAVADAGNANTVTGNASLLNVLTNDKFNGGTQATINDVTITQNTNNSLGKVTLDLATGTVAVAANTPAGVYTINYTITDKLHATKTSSADVVVTVSSNSIQAVADAGNANTVTGNASLLNVLTNDKFNGGTQSTINDVTITQNSNSSLGKVTLDLATGTVAVAANTPAGVYTINYTITDKLDATKTSSVDVVVTVSSNAIQAVADAGTANTVTGNASLLNVLTNDKFNGGTQATINDVTITQNSNNSLGKVTLDLATGTVSVAANTPAGVYTINYTITDKLDATKTSSADVVVTVSSNAIQAVADAGTANTVTGNASLLNVLTNDKFNGGTQATINDVTITQNTNNSLGKVTLDLATGTVAVAANTPAGVYTINYTITDKLDATKSSSADVVVNVAGGSILATNDLGVANTVTGGVAVANILANDTFNGGTQATLTDVIITEISNDSSGKISLAAGVVTVAPDTPAGEYTITYTITDKLDASKTSTATIKINVASGALIANNDNGIANTVNGGLSIANILANDKYNGSATDAPLLSNVTIQEISGSNNSAGKVTLNASAASVSVAPNTVAGTYTIDYSITDKLDASKIDTARITIVVSSGTLLAANDSGVANAVSGGTPIANVLTNDRYNGSATISPTLTNVSLTEIAGSNNSGGKVILNTNNGEVTVAPNTLAGIYTLDYSITDLLDPNKIDTAKVTVTVSSGLIAATQDTGIANSVNGGLAVQNILANDTFNNGTQASIATVSITENSNNSAGKVILNALTGEVTVAPNTIAGIYTINYTITDKLDANKTSSANIIVTVSSGAIKANDDAANVNTITGGVSIANILANDKYNGSTTVAPTLTDVTLTEIVGSNNSNGKVILDANGMVNVLPNTTAGTYSFDYIIVDKLDASKTDTARVSVIVSSGSISANHDNGSANTVTGGTAISNVLVNDTFNGGAQATLTTVTIAEITGTNTSNGKAILNTTTGAVVVAPNTPAGTYTIDYTITDKLDASKIDTARITVVVASGAIQANNDNGTVNTVIGGIAIPNILNNDTYNGGVAATLANVSIAEISGSNTSAGKVNLNVSTGSISVLANTQAGVYTIDYTITDQLDASKVDTARITVVVSANALQASDDNGTANTVSGGVAIANILTNDRYNGTNTNPLLTEVTIAEIALSNNSAGKVVLNANTGQVNVLPNTPAGTYTLNYSITDRLDASKIDTAKITVIVSAGVLQANNDNGTANTISGGTAITNILSNDNYNGTTVAPTLADVSIFELAGSNTSLGRVTLNTTTGLVNVAANTPAGTYTLDYSITDLLDASKIDTARITVVVSSGSIQANNDTGSINGFTGGTAFTNVLSNDTYNGGAQASLSNVNLVQISSSNSNITLDVVTGNLNVAANTPAGIYTLVYEIVDKLDPTQTKQATVTINVNAPVMVANHNAGSVNGVVGGTAVQNVLDNDMYNGVTATIATVSLNQISSTNSNVSLDPLTGKVNVAAGTPEGVYTLIYKITDRLNPSLSKQATVTVTVSAAPMIANDDNGNINGFVGGNVISNVLWNDTYNGNPATLNDVNISQVSTTNPNVTLDPITGKVNVAPNTPAGNYSLVYQIEDKLNPGQTKQATVHVIVDAPELTASNDNGSINGLIGGIAITNVLWNDTYNGAAASIANVSITQVSTTDPKVTVNANGEVIVAANTVAGTYTLVYQIEDKLNPGHTKQATVIINVNAPALVATNDNGSANGFTGGIAVQNVLVNDNYNGVTATTADVTISQVSSSSAKVTINANGEVIVAPNTPAGNYTLVYQIEDKLNPGQTKQATVAVVVNAPALAAVNDNATINGLIGGIAVTNVLWNDTYNGAAATMSDVAISQVSSSSAKVTINANGEVIVAPNTPAGNYTLVYQIEDKLNPGQTKQATVTINVTAPAMIALDDNATINGLTGGIAVTNVLWNDTYNGTAAMMSDVTISQISSSSAKVTINANGEVIVAPNTPAGNYNLVYQIEDKLNPGQTKQATVTITVTAPAMVALNDNGSTNGLTGGTAVTNVLANDTYNGNQATLNDVTLSQVSTSNPNVTLDPATGKVNVAPNTPAGSYTLVYQIEDKLNPGQTKQSTITVTVDAPAMVAANDTGSANGLTGGTAVANVLANDTYNGNPATLNDVTLSQISTTNPNVTLDPATGKVNVAPNTPAGSYTVVYQIEDKLNPGQTKQASVTVTVDAPVMVAANDTGSANGLTGGTAVANVLANDTYNGNPATLNDVGLSQISTSNSNVTLDPATGKVNVAPNTPAGSYTLVYQIEDKLNPGQIKQATVTITVTAPAMVALNDNGSANGLTGGTAVTNVLANDTYNGNPATLNDVTLNQVSTSNPNVTLDPATGKVNVAPNTPAGSYTLVYQIEDKLNPGQTKQATITVTVDAPAMVAANDNGSANGLTGGTAVANVLANDTYNGNPATLNDVTLSQISTSNLNVTLDPATGKVNVAPNTPAGSYTLVYQIEDKLNPGQTKQATITVTVDAPAMVAANDIGSASGLTGGTAVANVLANDTYNGNPATLNDVTLSQISTSNPNVTLDTATGKVNVAPNTPAGSYTVVYQIEDKLNPGQTKQATITVTVDAPAMVAANDTGSANGLTGGIAVANVLANDTYNGNPATLNDVTLSQLSTSNPNVTLDPVTGKVNVAPNIPGGSYTLVYQIEDKLNPGQTKQATVTITVTAPAMVAANDTGSANGLTGGTAVANVLANDTYNGNPATLNDVTLSQISTSNPNVTLDPATGKVNVAANTPAGSYTLVYQIEDKLNPGQTKQATITVTVTTGTIAALPDTGTILGFFGGTIDMNILANDLYNSNNQATVNNVTITQLSTENPKINIDPTNGKVIVQPRTLPGVYTINYQITDKLNIDNKAVTTVVITIPNWITDLKVTKTANKTGVEVGENISYTITVRNIGTATVLAGRAIVLNETLPAGLDNVTYVATGGTYSAIASTFTVNADVDAGQSVSLIVNGTVNANYTQNEIINSVTVDAAQLAMDPNPNNNAASVTTPILKGKIALVKTGLMSADGNTITYTFTVKNTGTVALNNINLIDAKIGLNIVLPGSLAVGSSTVYTKSYTLSQADKDLGSVSNTASINAKSPAGNTISDISGTDENNDTPTIVNTPQSSLINFTKVVTGGIPTVVGGMLNYTLEVKNTGNVTLTNIVVTDPNATITGSPITSLLPGASTTLTAVHILTQADIDAGVVSNQASIAAKDPKGNNVTKISDDPNTTAANDATLAVISAQPAYTLTKVANNTGAKTGDVITYTISVKNTGNVTLSNVVVTDPNAVISNGTIATLAPGATINVTATHVLTQADVNLGRVSNQANASAQDPKGNVVTRISDDPITPAVNDATVITIGSAPAMVLTKTANNTGIKAGDIINYTLIVKNTGNVTINNVSITDAGADAGSVSPTNVANILPGAIAIFTAKHTLTQAEINSGSYSNQASANGTDTKNNPISDPLSDDPNTSEPDDATVTILTPSADLVTVKSLKNAAQVKYIPGDDVVYNIHIKNNGPSAASNVRISDYAPLGTTISKWTATATGLTLPYTSGTGNLEQTIALFPGEAQVVYEVTVKTSNGATRSPQAGQPLVNTVRVTSSTPDLTSNGDVKTTQPLPAEIRNDLSIAKTSDHLTSTGVDTPFDYIILVKNNGNFIANNVTVTDALPAELTYVSHVSASGSANYSNSNQTLTWTVPSLQPGAVAILNIKVKANKSGVISNTATVKANENDPQLSDNSATDLKEIFALDVKPNVITPNGDGKNDTWVIDGLELYPENFLTIFNRWGNEVYHSNGSYKNDWGGNGLKEGTYYYLLKVKDTKGVWTVTKGYITLLRNN